jgi:hypothetical protein
VDSLTIPQPGADRNKIRLVFSGKKSPAAGALALFTCPAFLHNI